MFANLKSQQIRSFKFIRILKSKPWRTLVAGDEQPYRPHGKSTEEIVNLQLKQKMFIFMD